MVIVPVGAQQFYLRGEVRDESGHPLQNVTILQQRTGFVYRTGIYGTFGIISNQESDSLAFSLDGYRSEKMLVKAGQYIQVRLKMAPATVSTLRREKLISLTRDLKREDQRKWFTGDETYTSLVENRFVPAKNYPVTGVALNIDRASYSNIRRFIQQGSMVPPDAVRIEEMLNYFNLNYTEPESGKKFHIKTALTGCPWNEENQLFFIHLSSAKINIDTLPPSHLVFLIDVSGSMDLTNRLPLLKSSFRLLVNNLREKDSVSIVVYGGVVGVMLRATSGAEKEKIFKAIDELAPGGATPGESGIRLAYDVARKHFIEGGNNRIILATDGDFNVGARTEAELEELISRYRNTGIYLSCLGVGMGNYKDSKIQTLAKKGNGNFAYLDQIQEAEKVLLKEFTQTLYSVADDAYLNVHFNPDYVSEYRLIGFDNKISALYDSLAAIEGGVIGSGHSVLVAFEIKPGPLNLQAIREHSDMGHLAELNIRYLEPGDSTMRYEIYDCGFGFRPFDKAEKSFRFSTAVILFGSLLKQSPYTKKLNWNDLVALTQKTYRDDDVLEKEFLDLIQKARLIYMKPKKRKKEMK